MEYKKYAHPLFIYPEFAIHSTQGRAVLRSGEKVASHQKIAERPGLGHDEAQHEGGVDAEEVDGVALGRCVATQREDHLRGVQAGVKGAKGIQVPTGCKGGSRRAARETEETETHAAGSCFTRSLSRALAHSLTTLLSYHVRGEREREEEVSDAAVLANARVDRSAATDGHVRGETAASADEVHEQRRACST